jgi:hypothetical protein
MHLLNVSREFDLPFGWTKAILCSGNPEKNAQETAVNKKSLRQLELHSAAAPAGVYYRCARKRDHRQREKISLVFIDERGDMCWLQHQILTP